MRIVIPILAVALLAAAPLSGQEPVTPPDTVAVEAPSPPDSVAIEAPAPPDAPAVETPAAQDTAAVEAPPPAVAGTPAAHDWEFSLSPGQSAPAASGTVHVTNGEADNGFVVIVSGLPEVNTLDEEGRDVAAFTVWIVPSKDRVLESTLAGTLTVDAEGSGQFEGRSPLDSFGIAILAVPEGTAALGAARVVPVLTGIPVTEAATPAEAPAAAPDPAVSTPDAPQGDPAPLPEAPQGEPAPTEGDVPPPPPEAPEPQAPQGETPPTPGR